MDGRIALVHQHFCSDTCRESYATLSPSKYAGSSMNESVKKALSIVTRSHLRFVSLVNCNVQCERVSTAAQAEHDVAEDNVDASADEPYRAASVAKVSNTCLLSGPKRPNFSKLSGPTLLP